LSIFSITKPGKALHTEASRISKKILIAGERIST